MGPRASRMSRTPTRLPRKISADLAARGVKLSHSGATIGQDQECGGVNGRTRLIAMAVAIAMTCLPVSAQELRAFYTGNDLRSRCSDTSPYQAGLCMGFVTGIADAMGIAAFLGGRRACIPLAATEGQALDVVKRFLEQHPAEPQEEAVSLVAQALSEAFPCKQ